jgi:6-phosphogluconolactonase
MTTSCPVWIASAGDGRIDTYSLDTDTGELTATGRVEAGPMVMPMTLSVDGRRLYAVVRSSPFRVVVFGVGPNGGTLTKLGETVLATNPAYVSTDRTGRLLLAASYADSCISANRIAADGSIDGAAPQILATGLHAHAVITDRTDRSVYATSLGADEIWHFRLDPASLRLEPAASGPCRLPAGHGPRHIVVSPDNRQRDRRPDARLRGRGRTGQGGLGSRADLETHRPWRAGRPAAGAADLGGRPPPVAGRPVSLCV